MRKFIITEELLQAVGSYLLTKPMAEVRVLVQELEKCQEHKEKLAPLEVANGEE